MADQNPGAAGVTGPDAAGEDEGRCRLDLTVVPLVEPDTLADPLASTLAQRLAAGHIPYARMVAVRKGDWAEIVEFEVDVDTVQYPVHDIRPVEPVAVVFARGEGLRPAPEVLALREDFPEDAPHLLQREFDYPRSLCLYDVRFRDVEAQWTPSRFVGLIREWLRLTARGELHADDQPLERLLSDAKGWVILPHAVRDRMFADGHGGGAVDLPLWFQRRADHAGWPVLVGSLTSRGAGDAPPGVAAVLRLSPRVHGTLRRAPQTLADLHGLVAADGDDLVGQLRRSMRLWEKPESFADAQMILLVLAPKRRTADGPVESYETWAFFADGTVEQVGARIDAWQRSDEGLGVLMSFGPESDGRDVRLELGYAIYKQTREDLARQNGRTAADDRSIVSVGAGALGSQLTMNSVRSGFGRWTVIDDDLVLPHNAARHAAPGNIVGQKKAEVIRSLANTLADEDPVHRAIVADVLAPGACAEDVRSAFARADLVADLSASVVVARALARDVVSGARRVSLFLNPAGTDLTLLAEDEERGTPLDLLELQYYRAVAHDPGLSGALAHSLSKVRYGRSCRDVSVALPQPLVALHAGLGAMALQMVAADPRPNARVWRVDPATLGVVSVGVGTSPLVDCFSGGWRVVTDEWLLRRIAELRAARLPNETGGVLVGTYDMVRRIVYLVDIVASPRDSQEYPTSYMRGAENLVGDVERITDATAGQLHYVGEWHSHPAGHGCHPSEADGRLFAWLAAEMAKDGLPPLMLIAGDGAMAVPYVEEVAPGQPYPGVLKPHGGGMR